MTNDHPYDDIEAFALGDLEPERRQAVLEHADACPSCAVLVADAMAGVSVLAQLEEPERVSRPAPDAGSVRMTARPRTAALGWFAGLAAAACIALLLWNVQLRREAIGVPAVPVTALVHSHFAHHELKGPAGNAKAIVAQDGHWIYVVADGLTPGARYAVWETRSGTQVKAGEFSADSRGEAAQYFEQPAGAIDGIAVTGAGETPAQDTRALRWP